MPFSVQKFRAKLLQSGAPRVFGRGTWWVFPSRPEKHRGSRDYCARVTSIGTLNPCSTVGRTQKSPKLGENSGFFAFCLHRCEHAHGFAQLAPLHFRLHVCCITLWAQKIVREASLSRGALCGLS